MNPYITQLKSYLKEHQQDYGNDDIHSLLEMLWDSYPLYNPIESPTIKAKFLALHPIMDVQTRQQENELFDVISALCGEYERMAFLDGLRTGAQLAVELTEQES